MTARTPARSALAVLAIAIATAGPARAQSNNQVAAESLFREARRLLDEGKYAEACEKLAASQRLDPAAGTALNLARCYEKTGKVASAWARYREAASIAQSAGQADRARTARQGADALEASLPRLTIQATADAKSSPVRVTRDGDTVSPDAWGVPVPVDPGPHRVEATAPGKKPWSASVTIALGENESVTVPSLVDDPAAVVPAAAVPAPSTPVASPETAAPPPGAEDQAPAPYWNAQRTIGAALGVVGIAGLTIGAIKGLEYKTKKDDSTALCNVECSEELAHARAVELQNEATTAGTFGIVSAAIGGASLAGGLVLFFTAGGGEKKAARTFELLPVAGVGNAGLRLRGEF